MTRLVYLHGALSAGSQLADLAAAVGGDPDLPDLDGHGHRPAAPHELGAFIETALTGDGHVDLIGYSLGGYVALAAAIAHPDRVRRIVTIATKLAWTPELAQKESRRLDYDRLAERNPAFVAAIDQLHPGPGARAVLTHTAGFLTSLGNAPPLDIAEVRCPVLIIVGSEDALVTQEECAAAVTVMPDARLVVLPDAPHQYEGMPFAVLTELVTSFLV